MGWPVCNTTEEDATINEIGLWDDGITFHELCLIVGGFFAVIAAGVSIYLIMCHATHYSKPIEQRHIIRILFMVPIYSLVAWLSTFFYKKAVYYDVLGDCYEAFAISAFFSLLCHYIAPDLHTQKDYFRGIDPKPWIMPVNWFKKCCGGDRGIWRTPRSGLTWFNIIWVGVFQYCLLRVLMTIVAVVTQYFDLYCEESLNPAFSHVWVLVIECIAVSIAMYCLIQFYVQIKDDIAQYRPFLKILSIKLVIFLSFWQSSLISFLQSSGAIKATKKINSSDLRVGLPNLLISIEMAIFAVLHLWAFAWKPYSLEKGGFLENNKGTYQGGRFGFKALLDALNPVDLVKAIGRSFRWLFVGRKKRMLDPSYQTPTEAIGLNPADPNSTAYEGAGNVMAGGRTGHYSSAPEDQEEGHVLLSHAQPEPTAYPSHMGPPPSYDDDAHDRYHPWDHRMSTSSLLEPEVHPHDTRPYSPYEPHNNPYLVPSPAPDAHQQTTGLVRHDAHPLPYPPDTLQEQPPIPLPDSYQPPPADHGRR
ncbi:organic solute transporter Ostalpha-domain-containing protein [Aspergillus ambiguus]|uniref:organic solute transporter Ostalpha-domain-containing protein n=1 Tax=Aspergillus ambiguus TaxID=176160 RepID=UPI003CCDFEC5